MTRKRDPEKGVIIEFLPQGNVVKVSAIDIQTGQEVSIVGDPYASQKELEDLAIQKLQYVMKRNKR